MICSQCQCANPPGAKFCIECGTAVMRACPQCKVEVLPAAKFCHECGTRMNGAAAPPAEPSPPSAAPAVASAPAPPRRSTPRVQLSRPPADAGELSNAQKMADAVAAAPATSDASFAERRQLTVIFSDLVSFTTLSQQLDPEDLNTVVHEYYGVCRAVCQRYEGHVANFLGDGVLMFFGYPKAHEDDAHRAVRTALAIIEGIDALNVRLDHEMGLRLSVRVGVHTGLMIVGDDRAGNWQQMALGETLNIAARVQGVAHENTAVISAVTRKLIEGFFATKSIGMHTLKGVAEPMEVFSVTHESTARGRLEAAGRAGLTPLTGREAEVAGLLDHWEAATRSEGRVVLLSGEGGIGKSRLAQMIKEHVANLPDAWMTPCQCSPYHQSTSMYPFIDLIDRVVLKIERHESPRERLKKLEGMLVQYGFHIPDAMPVFGPFHSLPPEAGYEPSPLEPAQQRRAYMDAMLRILDERSTKQPLLFVVEDLHWVDPTTLETLTEMLGRIKGHKMLALFTCRPDFVVPWGKHPQLHEITLQRLDPEKTRTICQRVARGKELPEVVVQQIIERADGVPLFAEELTKNVIGSGLLEEQGDAYVLDGPLPAFAIPTTLQDSLMARLDRLSSVKEIAQIAAVIGREFSYELMQFVFPLEDTVLRHSLSQLVDAELLSQTGEPPHSHYTFIHALVQEAAYQSLVKSRRQHHHRIIAHALEEHFTEVAENEPEMLAYHYTEANLGWQAIPYLQQAGNRAAARSSHNEAVNHFTRALEQVRLLSDSAQRWQMEINLLIGLGASLTAIRGYGVKEVERTYSRARDLCEQCGTPGQLFQSRYGLWRLHMLRAEYDIATRQGEDLLQLANTQENEAFLIASHRSLGATLFYRGQFGRSRQHVESVIERTAGSSHDAAGDALIRDIYDVVDPRVTARSYLSWNLWMQGRPDLAQAESRSAIELAEKLKHPFSVALALSFATWLGQFLGNGRRVADLALQAITHCKKYNFPFWVGWNQVLLGWSMAHDGSTNIKGVALIHKGLANWNEKGSNLGRGYFLCLAANTHMRYREHSQALDALAQASAFMSETGEHYYEAERHRLNGELTLNMNNSATAQAERCFQQAIDVSRQQGARSLHLRAAASLAQLLNATGHSARARDVLAPALEGFESMQEFPDVSTASELLQRILARL